MSNTIRDLSELLVLFADNNSNQITAQDIRDFIVTTDSWRFSGDYEDLYNLPDLGTISSQDSDDINITGGSLSSISYLEVLGSINPGFELLPGTFSTTKTSIRSPLIDFKQLSESEIIVVPSGYMFLFDGMEVVTTSITGENSSLSVRFGSSSNSDEFFPSTQIKSHSVGDRHIIDVAQNAVMSGKTITIGVTAASSATLHEGFGVIHGNLIKIT